MKGVLFIFILFSLCLQAPACIAQAVNRQAVFDKYEPSYQVGRAMLPGLLGLIGGAMNTETSKGRITQQVVFFGCCVSIGGWGKRPAKQRVLEAGCFMLGTALGCAIKSAGK